MGNGKFWKLPRNVTIEFLRYFETICRNFYDMLMESCEINKKILEKLFFKFLRRQLTDLSRGPHKLKMALI